MSAAAVTARAEGRNQAPARPCRNNPWALALAPRSEQGLTAASQAGASVLEPAPRERSPIAVRTDGLRAIPADLGENATDLDHVARSLEMCTDQAIPNGDDGSLLRTHPGRSQPRS
jgi:hypothetical protein